MTYSFVYINNHGNGTVVEVKDFATDQEAIEHGRELLELSLCDIPYRSHPEIVIDKWADGYPAEDTFGTEDEVEPVASAAIVAEFCDDDKTINYEVQEFKA